MLRLEDIRVTQGTFIVSANTTIAAGARVALMGASGSGKSTFLSTLAGFLIPDAGRLLIEGHDLSKAPVAERPLSILFQDGNLFPHLCVFDNVALGVSPRLRLDATQCDAVQGALEKVGLQGYARSHPAELSGGQRSRVAIARMLLRKRPLTLLDEPFAALDPGLRTEMLRLVKDLCDETGQTLIMATHDLRDAERLCDHLLLLEAGTIVLDAPLHQAIADNAPALVPWR